MKLDKIIVLCEDTDIAEKVQRHLFSIGYKGFWNSEHRVYHPRKVYYLFADRNGRFTYMGEGGHNVEYVRGRVEKDGYALIDADVLLSGIPSPIIR